MIFLGSGMRRVLDGFLSVNQHAELVRHFVTNSKVRLTHGVRPQRCIPRTTISSYSWYSEGRQMLLGLARDILGQTARKVLLQTK